MATKEYEKECTFCKQKIRMIEKDGKWSPYNLDNGPHNCQKRQPVKEEFTLEQVLKKLESVGVKVNLMELMKE